MIRLHNLGILFVTLFCCVILAVAQPRAAKDDSDAAFLQTRDQWTNRNGDSGQTQYSALDEINTQNVRMLGAAWVSKKFADGATSRSTPLVHDGLMFLNAGTRVLGLDAKTGAEVWSYQSAAFSGHLSGGPGSGVGFGVPNGQGPAVGGGLVYVGLMDCHVIALDEKTGKLVWTQDLKAYLPRKGQSIAAAPMYSNGVVYWSITHQERYVGRVMALDAKDGHELWHFDIIPGPGQPGHESWPNTDIWKMGGGNVWLPPAVDPELGLVYYGTGNPDPIGAGSVRAGNNLYTCSVIALDIKTGKLRWYYQATHHDLWEHDLGTPLVLYDLEMNGQLRKGLAAMRKDGYLFLLDRATGKPLIPIEERPVPQNPELKTSPTQPYPVGADSIIENCEKYWTQDKLPAGFVIGCNFTPPRLNALNVLQPEIGVIFQPISFDPQTGYFYVQGRTDLMSDVASQEPYFQNMGSYGLLTQRAPGVRRYDRYELAAVDARTDRIVWKKIEPPCLNFGTGGWLTTAGGLAVHRFLDGNLKAFDAKTGEQLWQFQTGVNSGDATPMSYQIDGKQYIAIVEGTAVWSFALGGTLPQAMAPVIAPIPDVTGPIQNVDTIHTASLLADMNGDRWRVDPNLFDPYRARVAAGKPVLFVNNGNSTVTIEALDGSWKVGPLQPDDQATMTFDKPGESIYHRKEEPWSYGQLIVVNGPVPVAPPGRGGAGGGAGAAGPPDADTAAPATGDALTARATRGQAEYMRNCSTCHMAGLTGDGQVIPPLAGDAFMMKWQGRTIDDLFAKTRSTMPPAAPKSLSDEEYLDIVAYILQANQISVSHDLKPGSLSDVMKGPQ